jgi:hypothetical protein
MENYLRNNHIGESFTAKKKGRKKDPDNIVVKRIIMQFSLPFWTGTAFLLQNVWLFNEYLRTLQSFYGKESL